MLDKNNDLLIILPTRTVPDSTDNSPLLIGFRWQQESPQRVIILGALGRDPADINRTMSLLIESYDKRIENRRLRIKDLLAINDVVTNLPEITEAVKWAQISLDALITDQRGTGIWAGLPWFNNYWGRDTFISFAGALLCTGKFSQARQILTSFAEFQLSDPEDAWVGRIPNRITNSEIIYNTTDGTWWFIREVYEYILYSGDVAFVKEIFPVIKTAIQGALRYRIDENFFLCHGDAETWMDAKGSQGAWSPRGNRGVEIQALWYTALQIGSKLAALNGDKLLAEHWLVIAQTLKKNFTNYFWNGFSYRMYDHLNPDGSVDKKIRPNQIFTVTVPDLAGIEPLIGIDEQAHVTNQVTRKLTSRYGVASLWQEDPDFHPWHLHESFYEKDAAYHNGTVWTWLAGPLISALADFNYDNQAFELFYNESIQILEWDAIGNFSELLDALPRPGQSEPNVSGTVSQAWSLAEFTRNFYQDFIGFKPNAFVNVVEFKPVFTEELSYLHAKLPISDQSITFEGEKGEGLITINIHSANLSDTLKVILNYPGYDISYHMLTPSEPGINIVYEESDRRQYKKYNHMDWYFAQPGLNEE
jgi:glycogen debranching enzyme